MSSAQAINYMNWMWWWISNWRRKCKWMYKYHIVWQDNGNDFASLIDRLYWISHVAVASAQTTTLVERSPFDSPLGVHTAVRAANEASTCQLELLARHLDRVVVASSLFVVDIL